MKKIVLVSFFNSTNIGDNAICATLREQLSAVAQITELDITGAPIVPQDCISAEGKAYAPRCRFYTLKNRLSLRKPGRLSYAYSLIRQADMLVLAGGNMIMDLEKFSYYSYLCQHYVRYAKRHHKKTAIAFVGVGTIRTATQHWRWKQVIRSCDFVSVRDSLSKVYIEERCGRHDVQVWKDPVFTLPMQKSEATHNTVGINVYLHTALEKEQQEKLKAAYVYLTEALRKDHRVVLYTTEARDVPGARSVYNALADTENVTLCCPVCVEELVSLYGTMDVALTTRMHAFIIATTQHVPTVICSWDTKIDGVTRDLGLQDDVYAIRDAYDHRADILEAVLAKMAHLDTCRGQLSVINASIQAEFDGYKNKLQKLVEE